MEKKPVIFLLGLHKGLVEGIEKLVEGKATLEKVDIKTSQNKVAILPCKAPVTHARVYIIAAVHSTQMMIALTQLLWCCKRWGAEKISLFVTANIFGGQHELQWGELNQEPWFASTINQYVDTTFIMDVQDPVQEGLYNGAITLNPYFLVGTEMAAAFTQLHQLQALSELGEGGSWEGLMALLGRQTCENEFGSAYILATSERLFKNVRDDVTGYCGRKMGKGKVHNILIADDFIDDGRKAAKMAKEMRSKSEDAVVILLTKSLTCNKSSIARKNLRVGDIDLIFTSNLQPLNTRLIEDDEIQRKITVVDASPLIVEAIWLHFGGQDFGHLQNTPIEYMTIVNEQIETPSISLIE